MTASPPILPPLVRDQRKVDRGHVKLLAIFHFIGAGLGLAGLLFLCIHYAFFNAFLSRPEIFESKGQTPPPRQVIEMFGLFKWFYLVMGAWFVLSAVLNLVSAIGLFRLKWRTFSLVTAGINCLHMPMGTALGVFTIIVLLRESVVELYDAASAARAAPG